MRKHLLVVVLAACGSGGHHGNDAEIDAVAVIDALPDASPDAASPLVHVHAQRLGVPVPDVPVLFHDPTGTLIGRTTTDASGDAAGDVPDGSMVTAMFPATSRDVTTINTVVSAGRGDRLVFGSDPPSPALTSIARVPAYPGSETHLDYHVSAPCIVGDDPTTAVPLQTTCAPPPHGPAMAVVADAQGPGGFFVLAYQEQLDVTLPPAADLAFTEAWRSPVTQAFAVTGVPAGAEIGLGKTWYRAGQPYFGFARMFPSVTSGTTPGPGGGDAWRGETIVCLNPEIQQCQLRFHDLANPLDLGDDFAAHRTAWLGIPTLTLGARATIAWTADIAPDATLLQTRVFALDANWTSIAEWDVVQPSVAATSGTLTLPELPADLAAMWVGIATDGYAETELDRTETLTYAAVRARWFATPLGELEVAQRSFSQLP
jgi:hypothetical protein